MKKQETTRKIVDELIKTLSDFKLGKFNKTEMVDDEMLSPLIEKINEVSDFLAAQEVKHRTEKILLEEIINSTPDWIFIKDSEHRYLMVNSSYASPYILRQMILSVKLIWI